MKLSYYCLSDSEASLDSFLQPQPLLDGLPWTSEELIVGDSRLFPVGTTLEDRLLKRGWMTAYDGSIRGIEELRGVEDVSLLFELAHNSDGHLYFYSPKSRSIYRWERDPDSIVECHIGHERFVDWLVEQYPEQPVGRPWSTFESISQLNVARFSYEHSTRFPIAEIEEMASPLWQQPEIYRSKDSYSAIEPTLPLVIEVFHDHRGFRTMLNLKVNMSVTNDKLMVVMIESFQEALLNVGFISLR
ncbi:hypothetical protein [Prosthecobacter sp.]|uniref:hypothetical protein n=1 Tax=Prosthecobacter sp. TaxID=1965333 RepID=UPI001D489EA0|nr:hypothetical protein [Prosthecobacter sp.]MCB1279823.1 hypothetical protein [Prosthecobacter sp.]